MPITFNFDGFTQSVKWIKQKHIIINGMVEYCAAIAYVDFNSSLLNIALPLVDGL